MNISIRNPIEFPENIHEGDHLVQFYKNDDFLAESVTNYIAPALMNGEAAIIVATELHLIQFERNLKELSINTSQLRLNGQLVMLEAHATLERFMVNQVPDPNKFEKVVGALLTELKARFPAVKAYGEMVNILWNEGNLYGTMELEKLWSQLLSKKDFTLLCAYSMESLSEEKNGMTFHEVCQCHSHVIPAEGLFEINSYDGQMRNIAALQFNVSTGTKEMRDLKVYALELKIPLAAMKLHLLDAKSTTNKEELGRLLSKCLKHVHRMDEIVEKINL